MRTTIILALGLLLVLALAESYPVPGEGLIETEESKDYLIDEDGNVE